MGAVALGPMSLSLDVLAVLAAILVATAVGKRVARAGAVQVESTLWVAIGCALVAARAGYVLRYSDAYLATPSSIANLRDGGWSGWTGMAAGLAVLAWLAWRRPPQRRALWAGGGAGLAAWLGAVLLGALQPAPVAGIPAVALSTLRGEPAALAAFAGKPLVVNLWASWCPPCRREMPLLREAQLRHPDIHVVFVDQRETAAAVRQYLAAAHIDLDNVLLDPHGALASAAGSQALPTTLFFDARGVLVERHLGELSAAGLAGRIADIGAAR